MTRNVVFLLAFACVSVGLGMVYLPLGLIIPGVFVMTCLAVANKRRRDA